MSKIALILMVSLLLLKITIGSGMSWWWVFCPIWAPIAAVFAVFLGIGFLYFFVYAATLLVIGTMIFIEKVRA